MHLHDEEAFKAHALRYLEGKDNPKTRRVFTAEDAERFEPTLRGFQDDTGDVRIHERRADDGVVVHEAMHLFSSVAFVDAVGYSVNEGATEVFARRLASENGIMRAGFPQQHRLVAKLVAVVGAGGEKLLAGAYFNNELKPLEDALDRKKGAGTWQHVAGPDEGWEGRRGRRAAVSAWGTAVPVVRCSTVASGTLPRWTTPGSPTAWRRSRRCSTWPTRTPTCRAPIAAPPRRSAARRSRSPGWCGPGGCASCAGSARGSRAGCGSSWRPARSPSSRSSSASSRPSSSASAATSGSGRPAHSRSRGRSACGRPASCARRRRPGGCGPCRGSGRSARRSCSTRSPARASRDRSAACS